MTLTTDPKAATHFLRLLYPAGPWVLVWIQPDEVDPRKKLGAETFKAGEEAALARWLTVQNETNGRNVYYHVNRTVTELRKKALREDISEVCYLHVDVDPRAGEDLAAEEKRLVALFSGERPLGMVPPTLVVFSGGGVNALWRLEEPIRIGGDLAAAEEAKRYNLQLESVFGGDNCHNVDRILRLPGTINWPDAKKRAKGRVPRMATLLTGADGAYPLTTFKPAQPVQSAAFGGFANAPSRVQVPGNIQRVSADLRELGDNVKDKVKVYIVQGHDPEEPDKFKSRSEALFWVVCELVRAGVSDEIIYSVITDPDLKISESVLDKGSSTERYALKQIDSAREEAIDPKLRQLNERHAVITNLGGKCRVVEEVFDPALNRPRLTRQSFEDFRNAYLNQLVEVGEKEDGSKIQKRLGSWWLEHPMRRQYRNIAFSPGKDTPDAYNLWRGFSCEAKPGDRHEAFLRHVLQNLCNGDADVYAYLVGWMARAVQHPAQPGQTAVVLRGRRGTGKSFFARVFGRLWGRHFLAVSDPKHLVGSFNAHLRDCIVLFGDEAFYAGDKKHESILKTIITEDSITIEAKGVDMETTPNYLHIILASNEDWVVPSGPDERRFLVLDVSASERENYEYFSKISGELEAGGYENLLYYLMHYDLKGYQVRAVPKTEALRDQKLRSLNSEEEWWFSKLHEGILLPDHLGWDAPIMKDRLQNDYLTYAQKVGVPRRSNSTALGRFLHRVCPTGLRHFQSMQDCRMDDGHVIKKRVYMYQFPDLDECRRRWDEIFFKFPWPQIEYRDLPHPNSPIM